MVKQEAIDSCQHYLALAVLGPDDPYMVRMYTRMSFRLAKWIVIGFYGESTAALAKEFYDEWDRGR